MTPKLLGERLDRDRAARAHLVEQLESGAGSGSWRRGANRWHERKRTESRHRGFTLALRIAAKTKRTESNTNENEHRCESRNASDPWNRCRPLQRHRREPSHPRARARCDVLVVGGGINGAGIARDLAGPRLRASCCARRTTSRAHTSSSSTKLIHGGLRYLEYYEFSLVRKALRRARGAAARARRTSCGRCAS